MGLDRSELFPNWSVEFALFHKTLGQIGHSVHVSRPFFNPNRSVDPLTDALSRFSGGDLLGDYLRDRSGSWKQSDLSPLEAGLVWLLPLLNIRAVPLLIERKSEALREGKIQRGSADIVAYDPEIGLAIIDATRRLPDTQKRDRLLNTVHNLRAILSREDVPITPVFITSDRIRETRSELVALGVAVVDGDDLETIHQLVRSGNQVASRAHLLHLLKRTPSVDGI